MNGMSLQEFEDNNKAKFNLWVDNGHYFPQVLASTPYHLKELQSWETREDDVLICTYPKSGTLWLWDVVALLLSNQTEVLDRVFDTSNLELNGVEKLDELPSPRVLQSHMCPEFIPKSVLQKKNKIIYGARNPKDVAVSTHAFTMKLDDRWSNYKGSWENFLDMFLQGTVGYGSWFNHVRSWEKFKMEHEEYPMLFIFYEDLHRDCFREIKKISEFLELNTGDDIIHGIVKNTQFQNFKAEKLKSVGEKFTAISNDGSDPYFRKGIVGDWKNKFTEEEIIKFDKIMHKMEDNSEIIKRYV